MGLIGNVFAGDAARMLPVYEAKMIHHFDHRLGTYQDQTQAQANVGTLPRPTIEQQNDPDFAVLPRYWVYENEVEERLDGRWDRDWLLGWRDITFAGNERTVICSLIPRVAAGNVLPLAFPTRNGDLLSATLSTFAVDYVARQKIAGTHMNYFSLKQLPVLNPDVFCLPAAWSDDCLMDSWVRQRMLELTYTSYDMAGFAQDLGDVGEPFQWDEERRFAIQAELNAGFFHLYGIERNDIDYIMETFLVVKRRNIEQYGSFRTKELILDVYDAMAEAMGTGVPYQTILDPPPGRGPRHPARRDGRADWEA